MNHQDTFHSNVYTIVYSLSLLPTPPFIRPAQEGRVETVGEDRIERLDSLRASPGLPPGPPGLPPGRFAPAPRPTRRAGPAGRTGLTGLTAPEPSEVPSPALGARGAGVFGRPLKVPLAINTVEIVEDDEAEVAEMAELLSNRVLRF